MGLLINRERSAVEQAATAGPELDDETVVDDSTQSPDIDLRANHRFFNGRRAGHPFLNLNPEFHNASSINELDSSVHQRMMPSRGVGFLQGDHETRIRTLYLEKEHLLHRLSLTNAELARLLGTGAMSYSMPVERRIDDVDRRIGLPNPTVFTGRRYVPALPHQQSPFWHGQTDIAHVSHEPYHSIARGNTPLTLSEVSASILNAASRSPIIQ